jgi:septum formation protein
MTRGASRPLILASGSPRRRELLHELGLPFQVIVSEVPEAITPELKPADQAVTLAMQKAAAVAARLEVGLVLGADTLVVLDGDILGKPADDADAAAMLRRLSGREHQVVTGLALINVATGTRSTSSVTSTVRFRLLSDEEIAAYVASGEPRDKAGAYAIQGLGGGLITELQGCYTNVVGLPLCEVAALLADAGQPLPLAWAGCRLPDGEPCPRSV